MISDSGACLVLGLARSDLGRARHVLSLAVSQFDRPEMYPLQAVVLKFYLIP